MVTVVVGGQFGSEAKAKAAVALSLNGAGGTLHWQQHVAGVRCGGPNAGHTVWVGDRKVILRLVPSLVVNPHAALYICAGAMVDVALLIKEIAELESLGLEVSSRLHIDSEAAIVEPSNVSTEIAIGMGGKYGSTETGTGAATACRALRDIRTVHNAPELARYIQHQVWKELLELDQSGRHIIIEGTQGYGLSLYHAGYYPFCTSKVATAANFIMEAGIPPNKVSDVLVVIRTYPIRVGGNSGPLKNEISWGDIQERSGCPTPLVEMTSVTKRVRRVAEFDMDMVKDAVKINGATGLAVHGLDYLTFNDYRKTDISKLSIMPQNWLQHLEKETGCPVVMAFTGPHQDDLVWM